MPGKYSVSLGKIIKDNQFETLYTPDDPDNIYISSKDVNRPGLMLSGYSDYFDSERIDIFGLTEISYLRGLSPEKREDSYECFFSARPAALLITRSLETVGNMMEYAEKYSVPVLRTSEQTSAAMAALISYLGVELADRITRHGVLVEVSGEGVLIVGDSGVGKSETAVELIKRGHRLIADDAVEIRRVSNKTLVGQAPDNIRHYIEVRGVGIINARTIVGLGAVKLSEKIDMVIRLEQWAPEMVYDRMGLEEDYINILGIHVPATVVPVKPGRNLAIIIETAALVNRQKKMGYNAAKELMTSLGMDDYYPEQKEIEHWSLDGSSGDYY
jgi:HPr kinase/phosphorylase